LTIDGVTLTRDTNDATSDIPAGPGGSGPALKRWVDASITIGPGGVNTVNDPHTFTVTVKKDAGNGSGFVAAEGVHVDVTLTDSGGASAVVDASQSTCDDTGPNTDTNGQCTVVFTSASDGTTVGNAKASVMFGDLAVVRDTAGNSGPAGSGPATKTWLAVPFVVEAVVELPRTGADAGPLVEAGLSFLLFGLVLIGTSRLLRPAKAARRRA
jgi:hypothetical protein